MIWGGGNLSGLILGGFDYSAAARAVGAGGRPLRRLAGRAVIAHSGHSCRRCDSAPSSTERSDWRIINAGQLDGWVRWGGGGHLCIKRRDTTHIITSSFEIQEYYLGTATQKEWKFICIYAYGDG